MRFLTVRLYILTLITLLTYSVLAQQKAFYTTKEIIFKTTKAMRDVQSLKYNLKIIERGKKGYNYNESAVKFNHKPRKLYLYIKGIEVLWTESKSNGKALIRPNSFPYFNLNLDPMGSLMRQDQHHTLNEMGFDYLSSIIEYAAIKRGDKFDYFFKLEGEEHYNNRPCYKITVNNKDFTYYNYTVGDNESITSIARKLFISEYMILELNPKLDDYFDILKKGQLIKVPNWYAKHVVLYIDLLYFLPVGIRVSDDKSLFEEYNYFFMQVNPKFEEDEFTRYYKGYKF
jgi:hypothetical protein